MKIACQVVAPPRLTLEADAAEELMTPNPVSIRLDATVHEAKALMIDRNIDAAPVIDTNGRPVGVVTASDILIHDREYSRYLKTGDARTQCASRCSRGSVADHLGIVTQEPARVESIMTPIIFTVHCQEAACEVVRRMRELRVHHLFVVDDLRTIVGVISSGDVLRRLS